MFSNQDKMRKTLLRNSVFLILAVVLLAGAASLKGFGGTDDLVVYESDTASTQTAVYSLMDGENDNNWEDVSDHVVLEQLANEEATNREELLKQSSQEIEETLNALKMSIYPELNLSTYKEQQTTTSTTSKPSNSSKPVTKEETFVTSGNMTGTPEQIAEWEYALSQSNKVNDDVKLFLKSVDGFRDPYPLTDYQRTIIEKAVMAESGTEPYLGVVAIAQCLRESAELEDMDPVQILKKYQWTSARITPNAKVKRAVAAVFDYGIRVTDSRIMFFYAPHLTSNRGHETIYKFVFQISKVRFFTLKEFGVVY